LFVTIFVNPLSTHSLTYSPIQSPELETKEPKRDIPNLLKIHTPH